MPQNALCCGSNRPSLRMCCLFVALALQSLLWLGCSGTRMGVTPPASPVGTLSLSAANLSFGNVQVGANKTMSLSITSTGSQGTSVQITQITISGNGFAASTLGLPASLAAGQSLTFTVDFTPKSAGSASGNISISNDASTSPLVIPLSGSGLASGQLGISPATMTFSGVTMGAQQNQQGTLTAGSSSITVSSASWNGSGFSLSGITFPVTISAGQNVPFTVTFAPQTAGTVMGTVSFVSNATNSPATETLTGTGLQASQHSVDLNWNPDPSTVLGYYVYRGNQSGGPYSKISALLSATAYADVTVSSGHTYYYVVTAAGSGALESGYSNEAVAAIP